MHANMDASGIKLQFQRVIFKHVLKIVERTKTKIHYNTIIDSADCQNKNRSKSQTILLGSDRT